MSKYPIYRKYIPMVCGEKEWTALLYIACIMHAAGGQPDLSWLEERYRNSKPRRGVCILGYRIVDLGNGKFGLEPNE